MRMSETDATAWLVIEAVAVVLTVVLARMFWGGRRGWALHVGKLKIE
ncbi:hypothetical protein [Nonomuraea basaltis]|nr:hypothetical protein [Nonomuraea basaltis]